MNRITNFMLNANPGSENIKSNLESIANTVQQYINIILGAFAGILTIVIIIITAISFFKAGKTDNEEVRQTQIKRIKWVGIFLIAVIILWALSPLLMTMIRNFAEIKAS